MRKYKKAVKLLKKNEDLCEFVGEIDEKVIEKAEELLGIRFPDTYRQFLANYGAGDFGAEEIYGIVDDNFIDSEIPNGIWLTLNEREEGDLPEELVIIYYTGDEYYYCLDTSKMVKNECPVVAIDIGDFNGEREVIYRNFGEFLLEIISMEIEFE